MCSQLWAVNAFVASNRRFVQVATARSLSSRSRYPRSLPRSSSWLVVITMLSRSFGVPSSAWRRPGATTPPAPRGDRRLRHIAARIRPIPRISISIDLRGGRAQHLGYVVDVLKVRHEIDQVAQPLLGQNALAIPAQPGIPVAARRHVPFTF